MHLIGQQPKFKRNIAIDMVKACLAHYKKFNRSVKTITLDEALFHKWREGIIERNNMLEKIENLEIHDEMIFKNVVVKKGRPLQVKELEVELFKIVAEA